MGHITTRLARHIDETRDRLLKGHHWLTKRVSVSALDDGSLSDLPRVLRAIIEANPFPFTHLEDGDQALEDPRNREATRLILAPYAVARVQLALCRGLMSGALNLQSEEWAVAVVERDTSCAELAVRDWLNMLHHLCQLYGIKLSLKQIRLLVHEDHRAPFARATWKNTSNTEVCLVVQRLAESCQDGVIDLAVDVSVGCHPTRCYSNNPLRGIFSRYVITLRTAQWQSGYTVAEWPAPRAMREPLSDQPSLEYFLRTLFRKRAFREGQLPIVDRVLRRQDVIGLLPTGAGKSITFQLPALLSPGLTLVIDPIKSLMQDQVENLEASGVMDVIQINSDTSPKERPRIEWQFGQGEYRLVFISPERLQIQNFRALLSASAEKRPVAYVVIDEAHCVSEWGHDFRTAYLNLGRIVTEYCGQHRRRPPMIALTGTASESVLRDIQRELSVEGNDAIVRPAEFRRDELKFEVVPVPKNKKQRELAHLIHTLIPAKLGMEQDMIANSAAGGIVFCPHVGGKFGIFEVAKHLRRDLPQVAPDHRGHIPPEDQPVEFCSGEPPKASEMSAAVYAGYKARVQRNIEAGKTRLLVATSAFGMGIDKPNIRYTVHLSMPKSVEAFAQEAGRAGRDRNDAICAVLFTDHYGDGRESAASSLDCLELSISTEEAQARAAAAGRDSDDAEVQMYLHTQSYQGIERESAAVRSLYHHWIEPKLDPSGERKGQITEVVENEAAYRKTIEALMAPMLARDDEDVSLIEDEEPEREKSPRPELQRLIYRLSLLGIVEDYTVIYSPGANVYTLTIRALNNITIHDNLFGYAARYRTSGRMSGLREHLEHSAFDDDVDRYIEGLCWFVYEEIEQRRRQGMQNMRQMLRESSDGADFARRINQVLSNTALTQTVFKVLEADNHEDWVRVSAEINTVESAEHV